MAAGKNTQLPAKNAAKIGLPNALRTAVVTSITTAGVYVQVGLNQSAGPYAHLQSYIPRVGDTVSIFAQDSTWLILGLASASSADQVTGSHVGTGLVTPSVGNTTSGSYSAIPGIAAINFVKVYDHTNIDVDLQTTMYVSSVGTIAAIGVQIGASTLVNLGRLFYNVASQHLTICGRSDQISGLGAGSYSCLPVWLRQGGAGSVNVDTGDMVCMTIREVA